ncbi:unnamed protein product [Scytosiphon promiscuus]
MTANATAGDTSEFQRRMKRKADRILALEARVLEKREEVHRTARRQVKEKRAFLSGNFLKTWRAGINALKESERSNRMSDKELPIRSYSLVDKDVWRMSEIRGWFDSRSSPQPVEGFDPLASGYTISTDKGDEALPPLMRTQRIPTPKWAVTEDAKVARESQRKKEETARLNELQDRQFLDFEGNLGVQRARTAVLASRLKPPKGWGSQHTHVTGFRTPPWKERPPQEAPRYQPPQVFRDRDLFIQAGGGLETYSASREQTKRRTAAMRAGCGIFHVGGAFRR